MRTIIRTYEVYPLGELPPNAQQEAYNHWLVHFEYGWSSDNRETLNTFCNLFGMVCKKLQYDAFTYSFQYISNYSGNIEELKGQRLATYIINNYWYALYPLKNYWNNGKRRKSHIITNESCPLTGYYLDESILQPIYDFIRKPEANTNFLTLMDSCFDCFFSACRDDFEDSQSEENFREESNNNDWEYLSDGELFN